ncbi:MULTISPECIES: hypothetical protein [Ectopseudomonas]|uniref:Uncharacterized protein n=2 Tax=Ectopseudomonas TaxID=3236654 RepID=A0A1G6Q8Y3_9GAMM|nr:MULTISPECIES: hypothetical protein [Pseudomonas]ALN21712.1 hypothetical protein DW68_023815 [Pseudomonas mendocina S5.2]KER98221.1 hypothetical protein HN51_25920 [Pseudomonas mendocina]MBP3062116.1 hypothetical protein [Pseudomonas chengduensis]NNB75408.1 hypothetical protein [Pseudomonas chengduensis]OEO24341.1 hypothetical protein AX279_16855 [Pseudomonas sp. J237]
MPATDLEFTEYLLHVGPHEDGESCALLWLDRVWPLSDTATVQEEAKEGGFIDLVIAGREGRLILKSVDQECLPHIRSSGLYVIYQGKDGATVQAHMPIVK